MNTSFELTVIPHIGFGSTQSSRSKDKGKVINCAFIAFICRPYRLFINWNNVEKEDFFLCFKISSTEGL